MRCTLAPRRQTPAQQHRLCEGKWNEGKSNLGLLISIGPNSIWKFLFLIYLFFSVEFMWWNVRRGKGGDDIITGHHTDKTINKSVRKFYDCFRRVKSMWDISRVRFTQCPPPHCQFASSHSQHPSGTLQVYTRIAVIDNASNRFRKAPNTDLCAAFVFNLIYLDVSV